MRKGLALAVTFPGTAVCNARRAGRISNAAFAAVLALPLCLIGVVSNWAFPSEQSRLVAGSYAASYAILQRNRPRFLSVLPPAIK